MRALTQQIVLSKILSKFTISLGSVLTLNMWMEAELFNLSSEPFLE